jgi:hypothetical protein
LANILDRAISLKVPALVLGPPPRRADEADKIAAYTKAFAEVSVRRGAPYVEMLAPLANHEQWLSDMCESGPTKGNWPGQYGYGLMAWLVLHNNWEQWLNQVD